jgi:hypothetical protein
MSGRPFLLGGEDALEVETDLTLQHPIARSTLRGSSPKIRALNAESWLVPIGVVEHIGSIDAELERLIFHHAE